MATNIDKALTSAPQGLIEDEPELVIEVADDAPLGEQEDGSVVVMLDGSDPDESQEPAQESEFDANLADLMDANDLSTLATDLVADIEVDKRSRAEWEETYRKGLKLLGLKYEERSIPWVGACGVHHPMITEAAVRFQSETIMETFPASGPVTTKVIGKETKEKLEAAHRVREEMNYQLTEVATEYRPEHDRMLFSLPIVGCTFKKVYFDPSLGRWTSLFVPAEDMILQYGSNDILTSRRLTHVLRKTKGEIEALQMRGFYRADVQLSHPVPTINEVRQAKDEASGMDALETEHLEIYEVLVMMRLPGFEHRDEEGRTTSLEQPYVVSILADTNEVLSIRRNWSEDDPLCCRRQHFVQYDYIPGFGPYGFGLIHLIGGYATSATSIMRQLVDAGTLSNLPGGLKAQGLRIKGDSTPIAPGEFRDAAVSAGTLKENIMPLPYKEPSAVLSGLLDRIVEEGRRFAATADLKISDMSAQTPVGTTLALLERALKVMTAVQARVHNSLKQEFKLIAAIIRDNRPADYSYEPATGRAQAKAEDFASTDIIPVSDPNASTLAQRVITYQTVLQMSQMSPESYNIPLLHRQMLDVLGVKNADKLVPLPEDAGPMDPVSENMALMTGRPAKAFLHQDHDAHLLAHMAALQDPQIAQVMGQNPKAQLIIAAAQAHIAEHMAFRYRQQLEAQLGTMLPPPDEALPPEMEVALSSMVAKAAQQLLRKNQATAAQEQAQQQAQDPVFQLQQRELAIKEKKLALEGAELQAKVADMADKRSSEDDQRKFDAILAVAKLALEQRKQTATEELAEQNTQLKAVHYGNMGRAQDQQLLQADRDRALEAMRTLMEIHQRNQLGESRTPDGNPLTGMMPGQNPGGV